jgi:hypothetical protein
MKNYMEIGVIFLRMVCKVFCAILVLILEARIEMRMILERVVRRLEHRRILNDLEREMNKLMGIGMTMQNIVRV